MQCIKLMLFISLCFSLSARAASFDCKKAVSKVEQAICADARLSKMDKELAGAYQAALKQPGNQSSYLKKSQIAWLKERNSCESDTSGMYKNLKSCLTDYYDSRIVELSQLAYLPQRLNSCVDNIIVGKTTRFPGAKVGELGGEILVLTGNHLGFYVVSVDGLADEQNTDKYMFKTKNFALKDKVKICLNYIPADCPADDDRGKHYSITNYKNHKSFIGTPNWHSCGGA